MRVFGTDGRIVLPRYSIGLPADEQEDGLAGHPPSSPRPPERAEVLGVYLRLEPLGLELVAAACRKSGYKVRLLDLQASTHKDYFRMIDDWRPDVIGYSLQTDFEKMPWKFNSVYNCQRQVADHQREVRYAMQLPEARQKKVDPATLYVMQPQPLSAAIGHARTGPQ